MERNWWMSLGKRMAAAAVAANVGCVATVQDELGRGADAGGDQSAAVLRLAPLSQRRPAAAAHVRVDDADGFSGAAVDDDATEPATWAIVWHDERERAVSAAMEQAPEAICAFTSAMAGHAAGVRQEILSEIQGLAHPPVDDKLRWLPVTEGMVFVPDVDAASIDGATSGAVRWEHRARPTREGYYDFDAWHAVSRRVDPARLPSEWRDLLDHPLVSTQGPRAACQASVQGLRVVAWLHPYRSDDPTADRDQPRQWADHVWERGERHLVLELVPAPGCAARKVSAWRSARLPVARTFEAVTLSPELQRKWLARLLPSLRGLPSWRDQQTAYADYAAQCATPTVAGRTPCRSADLAPEWFAFAAVPTSDGLSELADRLTLTVLRDGGDLWIKVVLRTESEPCGGDLEFFGWHQSLWHIAGEVARPAKARLIRGLDSQDAGTADIDGDRVPDLIPEVYTPQEEICPC